MTAASTTASCSTRALSISMLPEAVARLGDDVVDAPLDPEVTVFVRYAESPAK